MHIHCQGQGSPTVVFDAGLGGSSLEWGAVVEQIKDLTAVCVFDRAGYGDSDMGPRPRTSSRMVEELRVLLDGAGVDPPYVMAAHSFGGYNAQLFARRYPSLVSGLVLVDASHPEQVERFLEPPLNMLTAPSSSYGIVLFGDPPTPHPNLPAAARETVAQRNLTWKTRRTYGNELLGFRDSARQVKDAAPLGELPTVVISRGLPLKGDDPNSVTVQTRWMLMQSELARLSENTVHLIALKSGHHIHLDQPNVVAYALALVTDSIRSNGEVLEEKHHASNYSIDGVTWLTDSLLPSKN